MTIISYYVRPSETKDAGELAAIAKGIIDEGYGLATPEEANCSVHRYRKGIREARKDSDNQLWLTAVSNEEVLGSLFFKRSYPKKYRHHGSFGMSLKPSSRGIGVGSLLLKELLQWAEQHVEIRKVTLEVLERNEPAIKLYKKFGFYEEGRLKQHVYFKGVYENLILMARKV